VIIIFNAVTIYRNAMRHLAV